MRLEICVEKRGDETSRGRFCGMMREEVDRFALFRFIEFDFVSASASWVGIESGVDMEYLLFSGSV